MYVSEVLGEGGGDGAGCVCVYVCESLAPVSSLPRPLPSFLYFCVDVRAPEDAKRILTVAEI